MEVLIKAFTLTIFLTITMSTIALNADVKDSIMWIEYRGFQYPFLLVLTNGTKITIKDKIYVYFKIYEINEHTMAELYFSSPEFKAYTNVTIKSFSELYGRTIFLVNPSRLKERDTRIWRGEGLRLVGRVKGVRKAPSGIDGYSVEGVAVEGTYYNGTGMIGIALLFYDEKTGVLVHWGGKMIDPLLREAGVAEILGGGLVLARYGGFKPRLVNMFVEYLFMVIPYIMLILALTITIYVISRLRKHGRGRSI